jgi:hypothetical protein
MLKKGIGQMNEVKEGLKEVKGVERSTFMWNFIESQLKAQPLENLFDFRKLLNRIIADKLKEEKKDKKLLEVVKDGN